MSELMTLEEVADYLRLNKRTIYKLIEEGEIPASKIGRQYRFNRTALEKWLRKNSVGIKARILVIDDDQAICSLFSDTLEGDHMLTTTSDPFKGLELVQHQEFDLVFLDLKMPGMDGAELFRQVRAARPKLPVIIITGYTESDLLKSALAYGPFGIMSKPFRGSDILTTIDNYRLGKSARKP